MCQQSAIHGEANGASQQFSKQSEEHSAGWAAEPWLSRALLLIPARAVALAHNVVSQIVVEAGVVAQTRRFEVCKRGVERGAHRCHTTRRGERLAVVLGELRTARSRQELLCAAHPVTRERRAREDSSTDRELDAHSATCAAHVVALLEEGVREGLRGAQASQRAPPENPLCAHQKPRERFLKELGRTSAGVFVVSLSVFGGPSPFPLCL